jgi:hypothetical protein
VIQVGIAEGNIGGDRGRKRRWKRGDAEEV